MIRIEYSHLRKLHEILQIHKDIRTLVQQMGVSKQIIIKKTTVNLDLTSIAFVDYLNANNQNALNELLMSTPDKLANTYIKDIESKFPDFVADKAKIGKKNQTFSQVRDIAYAIFVTLGYDKLKNKSEIYAALDIDVCPYCNRNLIAPIDEGSGKKTSTGELDHFYCKSRYPYLAISLYNLIPSCGVCNGKSRKGETDLYQTPFQNPYLLPDHNGMSFEFKPTGVLGLDIDEAYKRYHVKYDFSPNACLRFNFKQLRLKRIYSGLYYRAKVAKIEGLVRDFCNQPYIDSQIARYNAMGYTLNLSSLLKERLEVSIDSDEYSHYVNNKFAIDIFRKMLKYVNQTLLIK